VWLWYKMPRFQVFCMVGSVALSSWLRLEAFESCEFKRSSEDFC
jgi:hypothetical protein